MRHDIWRFVAGVLGAAALAAPSAASDDITLRSGVDAVRAWSSSSSGPLSATTFDAADFAAADSGPLVQPISPHPYWTPGLAADPLATWVSPAQGWGGAGLYAVEFQVTTPGDPLGTVELHWAVDDRLGDLPGGPNPAGLYLNGLPLSLAFSGPVLEVGGSSGTVTAQADVPLVTGTNRLYLYQSYLHGVVSGLLFSARIRVGVCGQITPGCEGMPNSTGATGKLALHGSMNVYAPDCSLEAWDLPEGFGVFLYGQGAASWPYGNGVLCIDPFDPGLHRVGPAERVIGGTCSAVLDFGALPATGEISPGSTWRFQLLYRDLAAGGGGFNLSEAIEVSFCD